MLLVYIDDYRYACVCFAKDNIKQTICQRKNIRFVVSHLLSLSANRRAVVNIYSSALWQVKFKFDGNASKLKRVVTEIFQK